MNDESKKIGVLFVCLGNICRSPSAQGIFSQLLIQQQLNEHFIVDSCGTAAFNIGKSPDARAIAATAKYGYNIDAQIARQIRDEDYLQFDYIIPMDRKNKMSVDAWKPKGFQGETELFMTYHADNLGDTQIPDPYHSGPEAFYPIIEIIEQASLGLLQHILQKHPINR
jgi:protein-tyrosine phosphatase